MTYKYKFTYLLIFIIGLFSFACNNTVQNQSFSKDEITAEKIDFKGEIGADGNDLVAYNVEKSAVSGSPKIWAVYKGYKWLFSSEENKKIFLAAAEKFLPQYEEYCPVSLSNDLEIKGKPDFHVVHKGKLYFFYSQKYADQFREDPESFLLKASEKWKEINKESK